MILRIKAFLLGIYECQQDLTFAWPLYQQQEAYDKGRAIGRRILGIQDEL